MKILALDTSTTACSVALSINGQIEFVQNENPRQQAHTLLPFIDALLKKADISMNQLDAIAWGSGPGSFTGVRIATSVAQGLGFALNLPLIPISSLASLAQSAFQDLGWKKLLVATDARMNEIYAGKYQVNSEGLVELVEKEILCAPEALQCDQQDFFGVGDGWKSYKIPLSIIQIDHHRIPSALGIIPLALSKLKNKEWVTAAEARPNYLRDKVVG